MEEKPYWMDKQYSFFAHKECEHFPCHKKGNPDNFNCLFCYCPLYALGKKCGGNFKISKNGYKDCTDCIIPHKRENYGYITGKYHEIVKMIEENEKQEEEIIHQSEL